MPRTQNLVGERFGKLTVLEKLPEKEDRYATWRCKCDCGGEIVVNTKRLLRGTITNCGCIPKKNACCGTIAEDLTGRRFGRLVAMRRMESRNGRTRWLCRCDCGNTCIVTAHELKGGKTKSCGCHRTYSLQQRKNNIQNMRFGRLTALYATENRDYKGSVIWHCRRDCGTELELSEDALVHGHYVSCGCRKQEIQESIPEQLTFVDGTCLEWLDKRKHRVDNTSGFRGVNQTKNGKWKAMIGLQSRRYYLGTFATMSEAVAVRLEAEQLLHDGLVEAYRRYAVQAEKDPEWTEQNPFYFRVARINGDFCIRTTEIPEETEAAL